MEFRRSTGILHETAHLGRGVHSIHVCPQRLDRGVKGEATLMVGDEGSLSWLSTP